MTPKTCRNFKIFQHTVGYFADLRSYTDFWDSHSKVADFCRVFIMARFVGGQSFGIL